MSRLTEDAVAELLDAAGRGELPSAPEAAAPLVAPGASNVQVVDFRRTAKFRPRHLERLRQAVRIFCTAASSRLSAELRAGVELEVDAIEQGVWSRLHVGVLPNAVCGVIAVGENEQPMAVTAEVPLVLRYVDGALGGRTEADVEDRDLTNLDLVVARRLFASLAHALGQAWDELGGADVTLSRVVRHLQLADLSPVEEPTLAVRITVTLGGETSTLTLLLPFAAVADVLARLDAAPRPERSEDVDAKLQDVVIELRAEVGAVELTVDEVLGLEAGAVVRLGTLVDEGVTVLAEEMPIHRARPGRNVERRALQIDTTLRRRP